MRSRIILFIRFYLFWLIVWLVQKPLFMLAEIGNLSGIDWLDWLRVMWHGIRLDISVAAYITAPFGLLLCVSPFVKSTIVRRISDCYMALLTTATLLIFLADVGTYPAWGFRLDRTVFLYLSSPREVLACAEWWVWLLAVVAFAVGFTAIWFCYRKIISKKIDALQPADYKSLIVLFLLTALLFLPIRGSISVSTINTGFVYFSQDLRLNQAAINPAFNLIESLSGYTFNTAHYTYMPPEAAADTLAQMLPKHAERTQKILNCERPNIFLIVWESGSANTMAALGGEADVTPNFNRLCDEGVLFTQVYASSFRTDRGTVAILSGFPGQPTASLMTVPAKAQHLPSISRSVQNADYQLKFYYGGDENFTCMRSYLMAAGFEQRVCDKDFPIAERASKWGAHDHSLFALMVDQLHDTPQPFMKMALTSSSHEPFEVPMHRFDDLYLNSMAYADSCLGAFVEQLRASDLWQNSLVVIVADHGFRYPYTIGHYDAARYHIPILMVGGAVREPMRIDKICSQIDLAPTLLAQLGIDHSEYRFGKNILDSAYTQPWAFYSFVDGFGMVTPCDTTIYDAKADQILHKTLPDSTNFTHGKAFLQEVYTEIEKL